MRKKLVLPAVFAAGLMALSAPSAVAETSVPRGVDGEACTTDGGCAGRAKFSSYGDKLTIYDRAADGYGVYVEYYRGDTGAYDDFALTEGSGSERTINLNVKEGSEFDFYVCLYEYSGDTDYCSDWIYAQA
ncbi:hypothetical protein HQ32_00536 [Prauserella sp. Am3]|nr:hypothetical protein HQ32_00536 [Prauserella sp. Am3]